MKRILLLLAAIATLSLSALSGPKHTEAAAWDACNANNGALSGVNAKFADAGLSDVPRGPNIESLAPDPKAPYKTSFPADVPEVFVNLTLTPDSEPAWITLCWRFRGKDIGAYYDSAAPGKLFSTFSLFPRADHLPAGNYEAMVHIIGTTETRGLTFTIGGAPSAGTPTFGDMGVVAAWASGEEPEFATSFDLPHESNADRRGPFAVIKVTGADAWVSQSLRYQGVELIKGAYETNDGEWRAIDTAQIDDADAGEYELVLTLVATGETRTLKFTVVSPSTGTPPRFGTVAMHEKDSAGYPWCGPERSIFGTHGNPTVQYTLATGSANAGLVKATVKYRGVELHPYQFWFNMNRYMPPGERTGHDLIGFKTPWKGWFLVSDDVAANGVPEGTYNVTLELLAPGSGDRKALTFTVNQAASSDAVKAYEKFEQAGALASWDGCTPPAALRAAGASFSLAALKADKPHVVFKLSEGQGSPITYTVRKDGKNLEAPGGGATFSLEQDAVRAGGWGAVDIAPDASSPAGSYEVALTLTATGETTRVTFNVGP